MSEKAIGSPFELSLRILLMLNELSEFSLERQQIEAIDFIAVYAADFGLLDENLHGYGNYRFSEFTARKLIIEPALRDLVLDGYIRIKPFSDGYRYSITEKGKGACLQMNSGYADEYMIAIHAVAEGFDVNDPSAMINEINRLILRSIKEVGHEQVLY